LQKLVDDLAQVFVSDVARNRGVSVEHVLEFFGRGGVMSGADAVSVRMADRVATIEQVVAGFAGNQPRRSEMSQANAPAITRESIAADHPAVAESFRQEGFAKGKTEGHAAGRAEGVTAGAEQERARIKAVQDQSMPGHEALIETLKFDGKTTGPEAAVQVVRAEKAAMGAGLDKRRADAPQPLPVATVEQQQQERRPAGDDTRSLETRCKEAWDADPNLRADFGEDYDRYFAYSKAKENGQVRVFSPGAPKK
jgi:capsid assembly protease